MTLADVLPERGHNMTSRAVRIVRVRGSLRIVPYQPREIDMSDTSRRHFLQAGVLGLVGLPVPSPVAARATAPPSSAAPLPDTITGLLPRDATGRRFVLYSDCCSGVPGGPFEATLAQVNAVVSRLRPRPEFIAFPGDAIAGYTTDLAELRRQWDYWTETEMRWLRETNIPLISRPAITTLMTCRVRKSTARCISTCP